MTQKLHELVIVGSGPAAMSAALYSARDKKQPIIYERATIGGLAATISKIENYPGFAGTGAELMQTMRKQAESFGAKFEFGECTKLTQRGDGVFELEIDEDEVVLARAVIIATGTERRHLNIPGENLPGVSYCATCDASLTQGEHVIVVGGGNSAIQEAFYLLEFCKGITILVRSKLRCDETLKARLSAEPRIKVKTGVEPRIIRQNSTHGLEVEDQNGKTYQAGHVFIFVGMQSATRFLPRELLADNDDIETNDSYMTAWPGLFAAGDCRHGAIRQAITAAGEGAGAAVNARKYLES